MAQKKREHQYHHHILSTQMTLIIGGLLLILTAVTVWVAQIDLGRWNFLIAMAVATFKAVLVALFFMGLKYESKENGMIFSTSFVFLGIFLVLVSTDIFFRGDVYVKGPFMKGPFTATNQAQSASKLQKPWVSTPELIEKGKALFAVQCVSCHGEHGQGNGIAAAALNPPPRNFTQTEGWKNGRKPTMVFKTLKEGLAPSAMASYASLPVDDRWALSHYVLSLGPKPGEDTPADFAKIGVDPNKASVAEAVAATIPIEFALERSAVAPLDTEVNSHLNHAQLLDGGARGDGPAVGKQIYQAHCLQCHGDRGQGGIKVRTLTAYPMAYVVTSGLKTSDAMKSYDQFSQTVIRGLPGDLMPGVAFLSGTEMKALYQYLKENSSTEVSLGY